MITHHFVMTSSLRIKILKIDKFGDFSCDIDYNSGTDVFRDVISHIINQWLPQAPTKCPPAAQRKQAKRACCYNLTRYNLRKVNSFSGLQGNQSTHPKYQHFQKHFANSMRDICKNTAKGRIFC